MEKNITLVLGGCRSGKSTFALSRADEIRGNRKVFVATSVPADAEMEKRVEKHRKERGGAWQTIEEPVMIHEAVAASGPKADVILVDCLTLWVSNLMANSYDLKRVDGILADLGEALRRCECPVLLVSNEVGYGIVPENGVAREFRDLAGFVNQRVAAMADEVYLVVAGIDMRIKPKLKCLR